MRGRNCFVFSRENVWFPLPPSITDPKKKLEIPCTVVNFGSILRNCLKVPVLSGDNTDNRKTLWRISVQILDLHGPKTRPQKTQFFKFHTKIKPIPTKIKIKFPPKHIQQEPRWRERLVFLSLLYLDRRIERAIRSSLPVGKREEDEIRATNLSRLDHHRSRWRFQRNRSLCTPNVSNHWREVRGWIFSLVGHCNSNTRRFHTSFLNSPFFPFFYLFILLLLVRKEKTDWRWRNWSERTKKERRERRVVFACLLSPFFSYLGWFSVLNKFLGCIRRPS